MHQPRPVASQCIMACFLQAAGRERASNACNAFKLCYVLARHANATNGAGNTGDSSVAEVSRIESGMCRGAAVPNRRVMPVCVNTLDVKVPGKRGLQGHIRVGWSSMEQYATVRLSSHARIRQLETQHYRCLALVEKQ